MDSMNKDSIKCPICIGTIVKPVTLLCGHTFCKECEQKSGQTVHANRNANDGDGPNNNEVFKMCPLCRFPYSGEPQVNIVLNEMLKNVMGDAYLE
jgi:hypothetical protein